MKTNFIVIVFLATFIVSPKYALADNDAKCSSPVITFDKIIQIVRSERAKRSDLPSELPNAAIWIQRDRCFYTYREELKVQLLDIVGRKFIINRDGVIVNATDGNSIKTTMKCPSKEPSLDQLSTVLAKERANDPTMPAAPNQASAKIIKSGCMFIYWETPLPEVFGRYNLYTFDADGGLYRFDVVTGNFGGKWN